MIVNVRGTSRLFLDAVSLGDLNGDGLADLAMSLHGQGVYVFLFPVSGFLDVESAALRVVGTNGASSYSFGDVLTVGDTDGDGLDDLVVSDPGHLVDYGAVHLVSGRRLRDELGLP